MFRALYKRGLAVLAWVCCSTVLSIGPSGEVLAQSIPASVEEVTRESDLIVLGKVTATDPEGIEVGPMKQLFTRHTLEVQAYYKGSGPKEISLLTHGGIWTSHEGGKETKHWTQAVGAVGAKVGEEILAFLRAAPGGYLFVEWDGAKYLVASDEETGARFVELRLRKKKYMKGAALEGFKKLEQVEGGPDAATRVEARLAGPKYMTERIRLQQLRGRIEEIVEGETNPGR